MAIEMHDDETVQQSAVLEEVLGDALGKLQIFYTKLQEEGEPRGIIGPRDTDIIWERHILNSAAIVPFIREVTAKKQFKTVADIGSGGGFPSIVAAAMLPDHEFTLIEPMERRVEWLNECVEEMGLDNVTVLRARAEEVIAALVQKHQIAKPKGLPSSVAVPDDVRRAVKHPFTVVTCRAVAPMTKLAGWTLPMITSDGALVALKGRSAGAELEKAGKQIAAFGGRHARVKDAPVAPGFEETRVVIVNKK